MKTPACAFRLILAAISFVGCTKTETVVVVEQSPLGDPFQIPAEQYARNYFFVDTSYIPFYELYYLNEPPMVNIASQIIEWEVWALYSGGNIMNSRNGIAWIDLPPRPASGYDSTFRSGPIVPGRTEGARFYRLDYSSYRLVGDGYVGVIAFNILIPDQTILAVAYRLADGRQYGDFLRDGFTDTTSTAMVLKLLKPKNSFAVGAAYSVAWKMLLKNVYVVYPGYTSKHGFSLDVYRGGPTGGDVNAIAGHPLLRVLGLDRFDAYGSPVTEGDGQFDFRPQRTIVREYGEIIFPYLRPFDTGIRHYFAQRGLPAPDSTLLYPALYDTTQTVAALRNTNKYAIKGRGIFD